MKMGTNAADSQIKRSDPGKLLKILLFGLMLVVIGQTFVLILHEKRLNSLERREAFTSREDGSKWANLAAELKALNEAMNTGQFYFYT